MRKSLENGYRTPAEHVNSRYGGLAVRMVDKKAFEICNNSPNFQIVTVPDEDVAELIDLYDSGRRELMRQTTPNLEPTSLGAVAALRRYKAQGETAVSSA